MRVKIDLDDHIYVYQAESLHLIKLYEVYKVSERSTPIIRQFGDWSIGDESKHTHHMISKAKNFQRNDFGVSFSSKNTQEKTLFLNVM